MIPGTFTLEGNQGYNSNLEIIFDIILSGRRYLHFKQNQFKIFPYVYL
jgi:hypothetical protein